jgi:hypothetical protein
MQNLANIRPVEVVVVGSALFVLCVAPAVLAWSDARRRRKMLARAAVPELAVLAPQPAATPNLADVQQLWDEPTVTVDADMLAVPSAVPVVAPVAAPQPAAVFALPVEPPAAAPIDAPPPIAEAQTPPTAEPASQPHTFAEPRRYQFCLQELRRVRLPNWPPAEVLDDPARNEVWREAERLAVQRQQEITATPLASPQRAQSSCLGSAEADAAGMRLRFLLFPVLWPSTEGQATAEAVFEIDRATGEIRSWVNTLRRSS